MQSSKETLLLYFPRAAEAHYELQLMGYSLQSLRVVHLALYKEEC